VSLSAEQIMKNTKAGCRTSKQVRIFLILFFLPESAPSLLYHLFAKNTSQFLILPSFLTVVGDVIVVLQNFGILTALSIVVALSLLQLMKVAPVTFIWAAIIFNFCAFIAIMIWSLVSQLYIYTIFFAFGLLLWVFFFFSIRPFISFTAELLRTAATIAGQYPSTQLTAFFFLLLKVGWMFFWAYTVLLVQRRFSDSAIKVLSVWLIFSFYWTFQVLLNLVHTTVSGFYATWYFMSGTWGMPESPVASSLKRAVTTSFGSVCLGSLIVAIIQTMRTLLRNSRGQRDNILAAIADCLLSWIEAIARYFNEYAFVYVATYGKSFCESARAVWELFEGNGLSAIINDSIVSKVMFMGTVAGGIFVGIAGMILPAAFGVTGGLRLFISGGAFLLGFVLVGIMLQVVSSGITTIFVCYAEDSEALRRNQPVLYDAIRETFGGAVVNSNIVV
jgi:hypothetical protein